MSNRLLFFLLLTIFQITACTAIKVEGEVESQSDVLILSIECFNNSKDTLLLPKSLVLTPDIENTIHGVFELYRYNGKLNKRKIDYRVFDLDIPLYSMLEAYSIDETNSIILLPDDSYIYQSDLTPFYEHLDTGRYLLVVRLIKIKGSRLSKSRRLKAFFSVE